VTRHCTHRPAHQGERGGATLIVTLILFVVMTLIAAFANRNHLFELRASANQYRSTKAFEAAETALEWATAMLNNPRPLNDKCEEDANATMSFRERYLAPDARTGTLRPVVFTHAGHPVALRAACVKAAGGWNCACPRASQPALAVTGDTADRPAFIVEFAQDAQGGALRVIGTGCTSLAGPCMPGGGKPADSTAQVQMTLGVLPAIATPPIAPLTARDGIDAGTASLGLHNAEASSGGVTVHAGRTVVAANARFTTAPGASTETSVVENDFQLNALPADRFFVSFFGMAKSGWKQQPGVMQIRCDGNCNDALSAAIATGYRMIWIDGDVELAGSAEFGTRGRPVAIVSTGVMRLSGPVQLHGVVYATSLSWAGAGGRLRGAAISESTYTGDGTPDLVYDTAVLDTLKTTAGSFARLPGSWKDF